MNDQERISRLIDKHLPGITQDLRDKIINLTKGYKAEKQGDKGQEVWVDE